MTIVIFLRPSTKTSTRMAVVLRNVLKAGLMRPIVVRLLRVAFAIRRRFFHPERVPASRHSHISRKETEIKEENQLKNSVLPKETPSTRLMAPPTSDKYL